MCELIMDLIPNDSKHVELKLLKNLFSAVFSLQQKML